jgi:phosphoadenosine phosphosulfate reductase
MPVFKNNAFINDGWGHLGDQDPLPIEGKAILSLARWRSEQPQLVALGVPLGVRIEPGEGIDVLVDDLDRLAVIALAFPKFTDGRSYSKARTLREQHGYRGELRACGDVLLDQVPLMLRCGFDALEITNEPTIRALARGHLPSLRETYQSVGRRSVARRRSRQSGQGTGKG